MSEAPCASGRDENQRRRALTRGFPRKGSQYRHGTRHISFPWQPPPPGGDSRASCPTMGASPKEAEAPRPAVQRRTSSFWMFNSLLFLIGGFLVSLHGRGASRCSKAGFRAVQERHHLQMGPKNVGLFSLAAIMYWLWSAQPDWSRWATGPSKATFFGSSSRPGDVWSPSSANGPEAAMTRATHRRVRLHLPADVLGRDGVVVSGAFANGSQGVGLS